MCSNFKLKLAQVILDGSTPKCLQVIFSFIYTKSENETKNILRFLNKEHRNIYKYIYKQQYRSN